MDNSNGDDTILSHHILNISHTYWLTQGQNGGGGGGGGIQNTLDYWPIKDKVTQHCYHSERSHNIRIALAAVC